MKRKPRLIWDPANKLFTVCAWCEKEIIAMGEAASIVTPTGWQRSHGICKWHRREMFADINKMAS